MRLEKELESLDESPDGQAIADYARSLEARGLNAGRIAKAIYQLKKLRKELRCSFESADEKAIEDLVIWINTYPRYKPWTKSDAKGWLKRFYRWRLTGKYEGEREVPD